MNTQDELVAAVKAASVEANGRQTLTCAEAVRIAEAMEADLAVVGQICNENAIKLVQCQLGCFK